MKRSTRHIGPIYRGRSRREQRPKPTYQCPWIAIRHTKSLPPQLSFILVATLALACTDDEAVVTAKTRHHVTAGQDEMTPPPVEGFHSDPVPPTPMSGPMAMPDVCPDEKSTRPDYAALTQAKVEAEAQQDDVEAAFVPPALPEPSPSLLAQQQEFLAAVSAEHARLRAMSQEERESSYADLKAQFLEE